jgi:diacylglycerol kinase family enzyme
MAAFGPHSPPSRRVTSDPTPIPSATEVFAPGARVIVLVNGAAGRLPRHWNEAALRAALAPRLQAEFLYPASPDETTRVAQVAVADSVAAIVVAGGDGTLNRVAATLAGSSVALGILPFGTGNDLAATLGLPLDVAGAARRIAAARRARAIDLLEVNGTIVCTVGLLGLVAESAARVIRAGAPASRWRPLVRGLGAAAWRLSGTASLLTGAASRHVRVERAGGAEAPSVFAGEAAGFFISNGPRLGGGLTLPTGGAIDDGVFELCTVHARGRVQLLRAFTDLMLKRPLPPGVLEVQPACTAVVTMAAPGPFSADGELFGESARFDVRIRPAALRVLV